ncbi:tRNA (adenine(58)-N(1))-methyltransferase catalytic subunit TRM61 OS=Cryptococcus neoformans var, neoformans serotype D (strain B-3501A) GN=TRM61 PE=3 SV=1 [Rhizoctonia solani AG-1 IB]|uniref:tRNA (adenine(58)-N(1))-methyltransferase catalytic subunit TRM61 n=1 Tax=Thanatephorus cucumeris (strain AG1-IB / isolate 7/3/14) TaxID=1108050 RepID=A0A0B7F5D7_THACB|nr:tRNA (adenine(58)-N(1))-methyltransferase catalytic subunit TRM61 OS=Cryptococcus neoformans var, neoformans serotype D (strain B-3501A) GN=TRM61 PE=3 SV=1 [Rhizoctonia solani AG-1 IB]
MWLGIKPGSVVAEAGTGSGSFSHSIARTISPTGKLFSFEFHEQRANKAREEFARHGMSEFVVLQHRNVCKDGFGLQNEVDSVFLDLPAPWEAIGSAKQALRKDRIGRICCFSPCMEQVLRTVSALNELGFTGVTMYETLTKPHDICSAPMQTIEDAASRLRDIETRKEQRRLKQIEAAGRDKKRKRIDRSEGEQDDDHSKRAKVESRTQPAEELLREQAELELSGPPSDSLPPTQVKRDSRANTTSSKALEGERYIVSKPFGEVRGHTSYLTFAMLVPSTCDSTRPKESTEAQSTGDKPGLFQEPTKPDTMVSTPPEPSETSATFDSLIAAIPEEELERILGVE